MSDFEAIIEIPRGSRNKYEVDHMTGAISLDRTLFTSMVYPVEYGFIPDTLGEDGDPLDAMVLLEFPTFPGCRIKVRPVAVFRMSDEAGRDTKILCVPKKDPRWMHIQDIDDVPEQLKAEIAHFFARYKDLEPNKSVTVEGWADLEQAEIEIKASYDRFGGGSH